MKRLRPLGLMALAGLVSAWLAAGWADATPAPSARVAPVAPGTAGAADRGYAVLLARRSAIGQKQLAVGSLEADDQASGGIGSATKSQRSISIIRYVVATEILEVSPKGNARRASLTVRRLTKESAGQTLELAKPGEVFIARLAAGERVVEQQGTPVAPDLQAALVSAVPLRSDDEPSDDDLFGTPELKRVGEGWPVHADLFAKSGSQRVVFDPKQVSGTVSLVSFKQVQRLPCLEVRWQIEARHGSFKPGNLPAGLLGTMTSMSVSGLTVVPIDAALQPLARDSVIAGTGDFTGAAEESGPSRAIHRQLRQAFHVELSKIP